MSTDPGDSARSTVNDSIGTDRVPAGLKGKIALVTGGASGIGLATALAMGADGARVVVADLDEGAAEAAARRINDAGGEALALPVDVADEARVQAMAATVQAKWGAVTVLANVAAITDRAHQARDGGVLDADPEVWRRTLNVDLIGAMLVAKHLLGPMIAAGGGSIVNVSSNASILGDATLSSYAAAKAGMNALTRSIAAGYGKQGVRANTVSPAAVAGPSFTANIPTEVADMMRDQCLVADLGTPEDIAEAIVFLSSDRARFITGQLLCVDGGASAHVPFLADVRRMGGSLITPAGGPDTP